MFDEWKERRKLRREIALLQKEESAQGEFSNDEGWAIRRVKLGVRKLRLDAIETERLVGKAQRLGIELPRKPEWWWDNSEQVGPEDASYYLTDVGKAGVAKLIREERRTNIEWWVKVVTPILGALISLLGLVVALVSVSNK
jgi:hypothetical protein